MIVIDDFGLMPLSEESVRDLLEIIDDRNDRRSTLSTSQAPVDQIVRVADAILDRVVYNSCHFVLKGASMRNDAAPPAALAASPKAKQR